MRLRPSKPSNGLLVSSMFSFALVAAAGNLDCSNIVIEKKHWDLSKLGGPHSVMDSHHTPPTWRNTTYTLDICESLKPSDEIDEKYQCPDGTRVCAIEHTIKTDDESGDISDDIITAVIPIAGDLNGGDLNAKPTRLDSEREGLSIELNGGVYGDPKRKQKAIIKFLCPMDGKDTESDSDAEETSGLKFGEYEKDHPDTKVDTLILEWTTKYACDGVSPTGRHWGFFTWFLIIAFLVTAAYLIFGSWLNYNRYGARGWDLLPHGDTIRDVPYLLKDWTRRVVNTVQGSGSRGGYSAV